MPNTKMQKRLNDMISVEINSSYLYLSMSAYFKSTGFDGFSSWMAAQSKEEWGHAMKFYNYLLEQGNSVKLEMIKAPPSEWKSIVTPFQDALKNEKELTQRIHQLMNDAIAEKDHATSSFLLWFVNEQVEEEMQLQKILDKFKLLGDSGSVLYLFDKELGSRA